MTLLSPLPLAPQLPRATEQEYAKSGAASVLGESRGQGSITIVGAVSHPGGGFTETVMAPTLNGLQVFRGLEEACAAQALANDQPEHLLLQVHPLLEPYSKEV